MHKMLPSQGFPLRLILTGLQHQAAVTHHVTHLTGCVTTTSFHIEVQLPPTWELQRWWGFLFCFVFYIHHQIWQIGHFCAFPSSSILIVVKHNYTPKKPQQNVMFMMFFNSSWGQMMYLIKTERNIPSTVNKWPNHTMSHSCVRTSNKTFLLKQK